MEGCDGGGRGALLAGNGARRWAGPAVMDRARRLAIGGMRRWAGGARRLAEAARGEVRGVPGVPAAWGARAGG